MSDQQLPRLRWVGSGPPAQALGVLDTGPAFESVANAIIDEGGSSRQIFDAWQEAMPDMTFEEWTAAVYALGVLDGAMNGMGDV